MTDEWVPRTHSCLPVISPLRITSFRRLKALCERERRGTQGMLNSKPLGNSETAKKANESENFLSGLTGDSVHAVLQWRKQIFQLPAEFGSLLTFKEINSLSFLW